MSYLPGKFVWFEHVSGDPARAQAFYAGLLGWKVHSMEMGGGVSYDIVLNGETGIGGYRVADEGTPTYWASYLSVDDVDARYAAALAAGAQPLLAPRDFGGAGRGAVLLDPTGAAFSLWRGADGDPADAEKSAVGAWDWNELQTQDAAKALAFYESVFGYSHDSMDMGPMGTYYLLKDATGKQRAGLMQAARPGMPSNWLPYLRVADCDATAAKATELGATVAQPPTDIPGVGRFSVLIDPLGAAVAVLKPV